MRVIRTDTVSEEGVRSVSVQTIKNEVTEEFTQLYNRDGPTKTMTVSEYKVFIQICFEVSFYRERDGYGNRIVTNKKFTEKIKEESHLEISAIKKALTTLSAKEVLLKDQDFRGVYYLNPLYAFKGKPSDRLKLIKDLGYGKQGTSNTCQ